jgi:hypothetical protein
VRILGFSEMWNKLKQPEFTTFRFPRRDKDWEVDEEVQIVYKPRSKARQVLGVARIIAKEERYLAAYNNRDDGEARQDGFANKHEMLLWLTKVHGERWQYEEMNRLILRWS